MVGPMNLVTIQARSWEPLVAWYRDVFGLAIIAIEPDDRFAMFSTGDGGGLLAIAADHPEQAAQPGENRVAPGFLVAAFDATLERLRLAGAGVDPNVDGASEGYRLARVWDPEGNRLHVYTYG